MTARRIVGCTPGIGETIELIRPLQSSRSRPTAWGPERQFACNLHSSCTASYIDKSDGGKRAPGIPMVTVLRGLNGSGLLEKYPNLFAYVAGGESRAAFKRALDDQLAVFTGKPPTPTG